LSIFGDGFSVFGDGLSIFGDGLSIFGDGLSVFGDGFGVFGDGSSVLEEGLRNSTKIIIGIHFNQVNPNILQSIVGIDYVSARHLVVG